jgi:DNA transformation protein
VDNAAIAEIFAALGEVAIRRMFGGKGVYADGRIVAVEVAGEVLLKADARSAPEFEAAGSRQWTYDGKNGPVKMPYWSLPAEAFDDPDEMAIWVRLAAQAAARAPK